MTTYNFSSLATIVKPIDSSLESSFESLSIQANKLSRKIGKIQAESAIIVKNLNAQKPRQKQADSSENKLSENMREHLRIFNNLELQESMLLEMKWSQAIQDSNRPRYTDKREKKNSLFVPIMVNPHDFFNRGDQVIVSHEDTKTRTIVLGKGKNRKVTEIAIPVLKKEKKADYRIAGNSSPYYLLNPKTKSESRALFDYSADSMVIEQKTYYRGNQTRMFENVSYSGEKILQFPMTQRLTQWEMKTILGLIRGESTELAYDIFIVESSPYAIEKFLTLQKLDHKMIDELSDSELSQESPNQDMFYAENSKNRIKFLVTVLDNGNPVLFHNSATKKRDKKSISNVTQLIALLDSRHIAYSKTSVKAWFNKMKKEVKSGTTITTDKHGFTFHFSLG